MTERKPRAPKLKLGARVQVLDEPRMGARLAGRAGEICGEVPGGFVVIRLDATPEFPAVLITFKRADVGPEIVGY